jgi:hypothetical protein
MAAAVSYDGDVVAWANDQAQLLRAGQFSQLDIEHIADEIEDVGKSEQRELRSRLIVLISHLLKCKYQSERKGNSWIHTIRTQRKGVIHAIKKMPSLRTNLSDNEWMTLLWDDAVDKAMQETNLDGFPETNIWTIDQILDAEFLP